MSFTDLITDEPIPSDKLMEIVEGDTTYHFNIETLYRYYVSSRKLENPYTTLHLSEEHESRVRAYGEQQRVEILIDDGSVYLNGYDTIGHAVIQRLRTPYFLSTNLDRGVVVNSVGVMDYETLLTSCEGKVRVEYSTTTSSMKTDEKFLEWLRKRDSDYGIINTILSCINSQSNCIELVQLRSADEAPVMIQSGGGIPLPNFTGIPIAWTSPMNLDFDGDEVFINLREDTSHNREDGIIFIPPLDPLNIELYSAISSFHARIIAEIRERRTIDRRFEIINVDFDGGEGIGLPSDLYPTSVSVNTQPSRRIYSHSSRTNTRSQLSRQSRTRERTPRTRYHQ